MNKVQVIIDGKNIDERKTGRDYAFALAALKVKEQRKVRDTYPMYEWVDIEPAWVAYSYHRTQALAAKMLSSFKYHGIYAEAKIVPTTVVEIKRRERVRCSALKLEPSRWNGARAVQCTKDGIIGGRCAEHVGTDNAVVLAARKQIQAEAEVERTRVWNEAHASSYTRETCPILPEIGCRIHKTGPYAEVQG
jgi:hypothetical protein